ncbi:uncharacterized protein LOC100821170 isoform X2 [Brachypodium distachyon]|uniref:GBF-interacting protein 1 N-terminal domain-containing protein n=1 Tax=Brachypodium distachyon TaxID=15368 RepID=A0A0Q3S8C9_BRADI|nr:uncharacterized protein LOC100821170 isoform X2 [Brachypodium distachyon]KQK21306.1 hypothetical protein BRADI_1g60080v3 [Brachypodium distachyon]|eukprot:XP_010228511.1 uncharacterized protein LOC100821170 isoform X2 [Brachypodium distachyon]
MDGATATATDAGRPLPRGSSCDVRNRQENYKENTSYQRSNDIRAHKERQSEWTKPGRVFNRNISRGGVTQEFRVVKDNRIKQKADGDTVPGSFHNGDSSSEHTVTNIGDKSSTEKLSDGHGTTQADNGHKVAAQAHGKEVKLSSDQRLEQSERMRTPLVGSHALQEKGKQNKELAAPSVTNNFTQELCCSSSDPIHVPPPGSRPVGTFGAIKREVGVVGARQRPSDIAATNISTSNSLATVTMVMKDNASSEHQSRLSVVPSKTSHSSSSVSLSSRPFLPSQVYSKPSIHVGHSKGNPHLEWKPKSVRPTSVNCAANVAPSSATSSADVHQVGMACLSKKLSQANVSKDERVIMPEHLKVPDNERTHLIFGTFESEAKSNASTSSPIATSKEGLDVHSSTRLTPLNSVRSSDEVRPGDQTDHVGSCATLPQSDVLSFSEHQQSSIVDIGPSPGVIGEYRTNEMISNKIAHSVPQPQYQDNYAVQNFKAYEPDSKYEMPFITKSIDGETVQTRSYPSEIMGLHPSNVNQLSVSSASQQPVPQMYQQVQVPQYPSFLPYRHVFSPYYVPPVAVPNYSSNPSFPQLPHASNYLVMPNGASHEIGSMKFGTPHQYKQVFPGSPAGYGSYANQSGYPVSNCIIGSTGAVEDASMSKYKDNNNMYTPNQQAETTDLWIQAHRDIPSMPTTPFYNMMGRPMSPHTAYLPAHNGHAPFNPAPHPAHLQFPGLPHPLQPTSMTMVQNPQSMVHQPAGNMGIDMAAMAPGAQAGAFPGAQVGAFQQNQLGHLGWAPPNY